ncbi:hypothetical protein NLG97_g2123 [Lecanicillium saksenae]|uniref:Uncharacterized protein n=1 Tax=Lecanicillium saksenae TaxID=468837 RepID=A0ACC1R5V2_9HYPO|nr:hypothetical protein NLG97_g2123 [Lecanicillium saksenae]
MGKKLAQPISVTKPDVAIVGGGAGGVAVVLHLIEQAKKGRALHEIVIIEKREVMGPGLAFSTDCHGTILNMHSDTMGIYNENPRDYTQWRTSLEDGPFPSRVDYGKYLQDRWQQAVEAAKSLGVTIATICASATDIDKASDSSYTVTLDNHTTLTAHSVVLALGNFTGSANSHLVGKPGYFPNPWPTTQLRSIPPTAHVLVVGSRLSAVDAALYLSDNGHQGPITFMSRSGKLPRVQGDPVPNPRRYILHELARQVEGNPNESLLRLTSALVDEISQATNGDWSWMLEKDSPLEQLETDLIAAQEQRVRWQSILNGTAPVIERYWNSLSPTSQALFMEKFNSSWMTYRHAMPIKNASRVLNLLKKSQLQVVRGDTISWDGMFKAKTSAGILETPYVVEATGQECHINRINSPLVQSAVSKGILTPHAAGGVVVDFESLQAAKGLYVMGSLTRGTHFYVSATDRVAAHASRIAKSLTSEPFSSNLHVAIFVGGDLVSHLMASKLVPELIQAGHVPYLFLAESTEPKKQKGALPEFPELAFFENELLQEHVIPYFKDKNAGDAKSPTVRQLAAKYGILVQQLPATGDKSFANTMAKHHIDVGLSLISTDISSENVLEYFSNGKKLLHLHSENLSSYRGVMSAARAMKNKESHFIYSLREMKETTALGHVIDIRKHAIDYSKSTLACMNDVYALGIDMTMAAVGKLARGEDLGAVNPTGENGGAKNRPSKEELDEYAASIVQILVDSFAPTQKKDDFQSHILGVVREWSDKNYA